MTRYQGLLIHPNSPPTEVALKASRNNLPEVIRQLLGCSNVPVGNGCKGGILYSSNESEFAQRPKNSLATQLLKSSSKMSDNLVKTHGPCFLIGENEKGEPVNVGKESIVNVLDLYKEMTGCTISGTKSPKIRHGPKRPKKALDFYSSVFQKSRRAELLAQNITPVFGLLGSEARASWNSMTTEQKAPYTVKAEEDRLRYETEKKDYNRKNPPRPKNPRNAYNIFCQEYPDKTTRPDWKTQEAQFKEPFEAKAKEDKVRYEKELDTFRVHCIETGKPFEKLVARKKRARPESDSSSSEETPSTDASSSSAPSEEAKAPKKKRARTSKAAPAVETESSGETKKKKRASPKSESSTEKPKPKRSRKPKAKSTEEPEDDEAHNEDE